MITPHSVASPDSMLAGEAGTRRASLAFVEVFRNPLLPTAPDTWFGLGRVSAPRGPKRTSRKKAGSWPRPYPLKKFSPRRVVGASARRSS